MWVWGAANRKLYLIQTEHRIATVDQTCYFFISIFETRLCINSLPIVARIVKRFISSNENNSNNSSNGSKNIPNYFSFLCNSHYFDDDSTHWIPYNMHFYYGNYWELIKWGRSVLFKRTELPIAPTYHSNMLKWFTIVYSCISKDVRSLAIEMQPGCCGML